MLVKQPLYRMNAETQHGPKDRVQHFAEAVTQQLLG